MADAPVDYDTELARYQAVFRPAWAIRPHDQVLDVGCGAGLTTREAARLASAGGALGVDVSQPAIDRARELAADVPNAAFARADAQTHDFPRRHFDVAISRFGTMFFAAPVAAFTNIGRALRPAGRLVMLVWQAREQNEWSLAIHEALGTATYGPDAFSLADPPTTSEILRAAGFTGITFTDVHEPLWYGPDPAAALAWIRRFACTTELLARLDPTAGEEALARLTATLAAHRSADGIRFDARAWLIKAEQL